MLPVPKDSFLGRLYWKCLSFIIRPKPREECHKYWRHPGDPRNSPESYISSVGRSDFLLKIIKKYVEPQMRIMEIGCNVGRNLNYLFGAGYKNVAGVEISKEAIDLMKKVYPEMAKNIRIYNSSIEDAVGDFEDNSFDVVFTMATFEHIHPKSEFIFPEVARITKKYLITIEDELSGDSMRFPRNYQKIFEHLGMKQVYKSDCEELGEYYGYFKARVFLKKDKVF